MTSVGNLLAPYARLLKLKRTAAWRAMALVVLWATIPGQITESQVYAQSPPDLSGTWRGTLEAAQFDPLEIVFRIMGDAGNYSATLDIPSQSRIGLPVDSVRISGSNITLRMDALQAEYYASLVMTDDGSAVESFNGDWSQSGEHIPLRMRKDSR